MVDFDTGNILNLTSPEIKKLRKKAWNNKGAVVNYLDLIYLTTDLPADDYLRVLKKLAGVE